MSQEKMNKLISKLMIIPVLTTGLVLINTNSAMATGGFSQTCSDIKIDGSTLSADCKTRSGDDNKTSINLDIFIGNLDGVLSWGDKDFTITCNDIELDRHTLKANCQRRDGGYWGAEINLDDFISNIDGTLEYDEAE